MAGRFVHLSILLSCLLFASSLTASAGTVNPDGSFERKLADEKDDSYGIPGLSHITVSGAVLHGNKEVEVWLETAAPGTGTPIHRHDCEEIFVITKGSGTVYVAPASDKDSPGEPEAIPFSTNSTFSIPPNAVHQVVNTNETEDCQFFVILSRPPLKSYVYKKWSTPHAEAVLLYPIPWDMEAVADKKDEKDEL